MVVPEQAIEEDSHLEEDKQEDIELEDKDFVDSCKP